MIIGGAGLMGRVTALDLVESLNVDEITKSLNPYIFHRGDVSCSTR
jgi:hypothetical protein